MELPLSGIPTRRWPALKIIFPYFAPIKGWLLQIDSWFESISCPAFPSW